MKRVILLCAVVALALATQPALAATICSIGFEANEAPPAYVVGHDNLGGQDGWITSVPWHVQDYAGVGGGIPWSPPSVGAQVLYVPPTNPLGGDQFMGKGTSINGGQGNGTAFRATPMAGGVVKTSVDFLNGPEHDFPLYQGAFFNIDEIDGANNSLTGFYGRAESGYVDTAPPRVGGWAPSWRIFDVNGTQMKNEEVGFTLVDVAGFDHLVRATWHRLSWTYDQDTHRITELSAQDIQNGGPAYVLPNPQALWDEDGDGPNPAVLTDMYTRGGAAGTNADGVLLVADGVLTYNVGNGQIHCFDNIDITGVVVPEPSTVVMLLAGLMGLAVYWRRRK